MRSILHVPYAWYPDPCGGTEVYVQSLIAALLRLGWQGVVAAPGATEERATINGIEVYRMPVSTVEVVEDAYSEEDLSVTRAFERVLDRVCPSLIHLHSRTRAVSIGLVRVAHQRGLPVIFTYHTPTVTCLRGTMMRWGSQVCDGVMLPTRCTACVAHGKGVPRFLAEGFARLPSSLTGSLSKMSRHGRLGTALQLHELTQRSHEIIRAFLLEVDHIVAVRGWVREVLFQNGMPEAKVSLCPQGVAVQQTRRVLPVSSKDGYTRLLFLGRLSRDKGLDLVIDALLRLPSARLLLNVYGIREPGNEYAAGLEHRAQGDVRIRFFEPVASEDVIELLQQCDVLVVPSRWMETGPLVVMEAFSAGIPVIASRLGGCEELVRDGIDGLLVESDSVTAWENVLRTLAEDPQCLLRLRSKVISPRTLDQMALEMQEIYRQQLLPN